LEEVHNNPNARVVTSQEALDIVESLKSSKSKTVSLASYNPPKIERKEAPVREQEDFLMVKDVNNMA
jgi:hypothetical protein